MTLPLHDPRWQSLLGGYGIAYDPSCALDSLEHGGNSWNELWENLHHQGDVGVSSYAAVPHISRIASKLKPMSWQPYGLVATIEIERHRKSNPALPDWLVEPYMQAIKALAELGVAELSQTQDPLLIQCILGFLALAQGHIKLGALVCNIDQSEIEEIVEERLAWSSIYA